MATLAMTFDYAAHVAALKQNAATLEAPQDPDELLRRAAVWLTVHAWRRSGPLEDWHSQKWGPSEGEMMQMNVSSARIIRRHLSLDGTDWETIANELVAPSRILPSGKRLSELLTTSRRRRLREHIHQMMYFYYKVETHAGARLQLTSYASGTSFWASGWYWIPGWRDHVELVRAVISDPEHDFWRIGTWSTPPQGVEHLIAGLLAGPDTLTLEEADWYGYNYLGMVS